MTGAIPRADRRGLTLPATLTADCQVLFDGVPIWTFTPDPDPDAGELYVPWPTNMRPWLRGWSDVTVRSGEHVVELGEVQFGDAEGRVAFVDAQGIPVVIDKWGIVQRPFAARGDSVTGYMTDYAERIIDVLARECDVHLWMAFGTLLGAARGGRAIGHDSDMDFAYLSDKATPAEMTRELYAMKRALTRAGMRVITKSGSFITVAFEAPDGGPASIDIYTTFYVSGLLHETATVRAPVPREAILPLGTLEFEGRPMPAPADPDALLTASYGPQWRTPDPGFRHRPGPEILDRFDGWFGTLFRQRREWEVYWRDAWRAHHDTGSDFRDWVAGQLAPGTTVFDVGAGRGADAVAFAEQGFTVHALDYARQAFKAVRAAPPEVRERVTTQQLNLYDVRDVATLGALLARRVSGPRALYASHLVDALPVDGRENLWRFARMVLRGQGRMYAQFDEISAPGGAKVRFAGSGGRQFPVRLPVLEAEWTAAGARTVERVRVPAPTPEDPDRLRWRIVLDWTG